MLNVKINVIKAVNENNVRSSYEWHKLIYPNLVILEAHGWDRNNYEYSFFREKISVEEFESRLAVSTVIHNTDYLVR
jgi:hypothetical protein